MQDWAIYCKSKRAANDRLINPNSIMKPIFKHLLMTDLLFADKPNISTNRSFLAYAVIYSTEAFLC